MVEEIGKQSLRVFDGADGVEGIVKLEEAGSGDNAEYIGVGVSFA